MFQNQRNPDFKWHQLVNIMQFIDKIISRPKQGIMLYEVLPKVIPICTAFTLQYLRQHDGLLVVKCVFTKDEVAISS